MLKNALQGPSRQIIKNAGLEDAVIVNEIMQSKKSNGFDARTEKHVDMICFRMDFCI